MIRRFTTLLTICCVAAVATAGAAGAHVTVDGPGARQGGYAVLTFRVPNEESDARTVGLKVQLPPDHPLASVSVQPKDGWDVTTKRSRPAEPLEVHGSTVDEVVSEVEWSGDGFGPGEFEQFTIQVGPLPTDTDTLVFKAIQTYRDADGSTHEVAWIQEPTTADEDPERPAPTLTLTAADAAGAASAGPSTTTAAPVSARSQRNANQTTLDVFAMAFGAAGLVMAIAALVLAIAARQKVTMMVTDDHPDRG